MILAYLLTVKSSIRGKSYQQHKEYEENVAQKVDGSQKGGCTFDSFEIEIAQNHAE